MIHYLISTFSFSVLFLLSLISGHKENGSILLDRQICTKELEEVVYFVKSPTYYFLKKLSLEVDLVSPAFWNDPSIVPTLMARIFNPYRQYLGYSAYNALGQYVIYPGGPVLPNNEGNGAAFFRAMALGEAYEANPDFFERPYWRLCKIYRNPSGDGQLFLICITALTTINNF